jgi:peroxiredoxin
MIHAQIDLSNLHKAEDDEIDHSKPLMLDGISIPVFDLNHHQITPDSLQYFLISGDYVPEPYVNDKKEVKAFVFRLLTEEERAFIAEMYAPQNEEQLKNFIVPMDLQLRNLKNKACNLSSFNPHKEKILVINFWFIECQPCNSEMPELNELVKKYKDYDVEFLAIALNEPKQLKKFLSKTTFDYQVLSASEEEVARMEISGFPTHLIINREGKAVYKSTGLTPVSLELLDKAIHEQLP